MAEFSKLCLSEHFLFTPGVHDQQEKRYVVDLEWYSTVKSDCFLATKRDARGPLFF